MLRPLVPVLAALLAATTTAQGWVDRTPINPSQRPSNRAFPAMCWDAAHGYALMFGGYVGPYGGLSNETWTWNGTAWTPRAVVTPPSTGGISIPQIPPATAMAFHPPTGDVLLVVRDTTYSWNGSNWFVQAGTIGSNLFGLPANTAMAHDPVRNQTVLYVGSRTNSFRADVSETFLWSGFGWTQVPTATLPYPVDYPSVAFDAVSGKLVLCVTGNGQTAFFEWNGNNWQQRFVAGAPSSGGALASDSGNNRIVLFDGVMNVLPNHTWTLSNGTITQLAMGIEPARRFGTAMVFDPVRSRTVMFGGVNNLPPVGQVFPLGDLWELDLGTGPAYTFYGSGCAGSGGVPTLSPQGTSLPRAGQNFQLHVGNLPFTAPTFLFFGLSNTTYAGLPLPLPLAVLGAPGCTGLSSAEDVQFLTNVLGTAVWSVTIPNVPGAHFYNQAIVFDAAANALGITTSNGGHGVIGF